MKNIASSERIANNAKEPTKALVSELMEEIKEHKIEIFELMRKPELKARATAPTGTVPPETWSQTVTSHRSIHTRGPQSGLESRR
jgi:hypothetical protein